MKLWVRKISDDGERHEREVGSLEELVALGEGNAVALYPPSAEGDWRSRWSEMSDAWRDYDEAERRGLLFVDILDGYHEW